MTSVDISYRGLVIHPPLPPVPKKFSITYMVHSMKLPPIPKHKHLVLQIRALVHVR